MKKATTRFLAILLLAVPGVGQAHMEPGIASALDQSQPYRIAYQDRLVTDVFINGRGPFTFVIDSASSRTVIYEHVRAQLGLKASSPEPIIVFGINRSMPAMAVEPDRLDVVGQQIRGLTMGVLPDTEQKDDPDGVLGVDALSRYFVVLDRSTMRLKLLPREAAKAYTGWDRMTLTPRPLKNLAVTFWFVSTAFNGHIMPALFDLGSGITLMNWMAAERLGMERHAAILRYGPPPEGLRDVLGEVAPAVVVNGVKIAFADQAWHKQEVLVSDAPVFDFFDMGDKPGAIIGPGLLKDNSLAIDFAGHALYIGPKVAPTAID